MSFFTKPENEGFQYSVLQLLSSTQFFSQIVIGKTRPDHCTLLETVFYGL